MNSFDRNAAYFLGRAAKNLDDAGRRFRTSEVRDTMTRFASELETDSERSKAWQAFDDGYREVPQTKEPESDKPRLTQIMGSEIRKGMLRPYYDENSKGVEFREIAWVDRLDGKCLRAVMTDGKTEHYTHDWIYAFADN